MTIPTTEPSEFRAGDTLTWQKSLSDYPASAGWTLKYALRGASKIDITAAASGDSHLVTVAASTSTTWAAGVYSWQSYVEKGSERYTIATGQITIKPNLVAANAGYDGRSHAKKTLDAIEAVLEKRASKDQLEYTLHGRSLRRTPVADLLVLRDRYKAEYAAEVAAEKIARGENTGRGRVLVRFS